MITEKDFLNAREVLGKVASHCGFNIDYVKQYTDIAVSVSLYSFNLDMSDSQLLSALKDRGFEFDESKERKAYYVALNDVVEYGGNPSAGTYESQSFCWPKDQKPPYILEAKVDVVLSEKKHGAILTPHMSAPSSEAVYQSTHNKLLKVLTEYFKPEHVLLNKLVANHFEEVVVWSDIGLGGLGSLGNIFAEFTASEKLRTLARSSLSPFNPQPFKQTFESQQYYVPGWICPQLFYQWDKQLADFRESLKRK